MTIDQIARDAHQPRQDQGDGPEAHQPPDSEGLLRRDEEQRADDDQADSEQQCRKAFGHHVYSGFRMCEQPPQVTEDTEKSLYSLCALCDLRWLIVFIRLKAV